MLSIFEIMGRIAIDNGAADKALDETTANAREAGAKISSAFESIGNKAVAIGKTIAAGLAVGTAAIGALTVGAMKQAGELEQNMGGSEAVFKEHAEKMQETAKTAYKNMGLSASSFLATANKMGALFQGVGFDIEESATISAEAMQRAADVASIMGVDLESAMESIAGAAKGNFSMLDNLGVAVNDTTLEMYALSQGIDKATSDMTTQEKVALAMQLFMEKTAYATGNYAKENDTLAGSLSTAKAALDNFLSGAGDATALAEAVMDSAEVILTKLDSLLPSLVTGIGTLVKKLAPKLPGLLTRLVPAAVEAMSGIIKAILPELPKMIAEIAPVLIQGAKDLGTAMIEAIKETIPVLNEVFEDLGVRLSDLLIMVGGVVLAFKGFSIVSTVISAVKTLKTAFVGLNAVLAANPIGMVVTALGLLALAIGAARDASYKAIEPAYELSDAEKAIRDKANEAAEAHQRLTDAYADDAQKIEAETRRTQDLWKELQTLCDENGNVKKGYEERAAFIAQELSEATGLEISLVDGVITKYQELSDAIDEAIKKSQAEALLNANKGVYEDAVAGAEQAIDDANIAYREYQEEKARQDAALSERAALLTERAVLTHTDSGVDDGGEATQRLIAINTRLEELKEELERPETGYNARVEATAKAYQEANEEALKYYQDKMDYENASAAFLAGNYEETVGILTNDIRLRWEHFAETQKIAAEQKKQMEADVKFYGDRVRWMEEQIASGNTQITQDILQNAKEARDGMYKIWQDAVSDSRIAGGEYTEAFRQGIEAGGPPLSKAVTTMAEKTAWDLVHGVTKGLEDKASEIYSTARLVMSNTIGAMREVAQIASPSKVTAEFGRFLVEGLSEGIADNQHMAEVAASDAMYRTTDSFAQGLTTPHGSATESTNEAMQELRREFAAFTHDLPDMMAEAFAAMSLKINNREFGRMVREVT